MTEIYPALVQRPPLSAMAERLASRSSSLRRDECGDWRINGLDGHIYAVLEGFQFVVFKQGLRGWNVAKYRLAFCPLTQGRRLNGNRSADEARDKQLVAQRFAAVCARGLNPGILSLVYRDICSAPV